MLINIFGKRGAGKTTLIRGNIKDCKGPVVILDILGNYDEKSLLKNKIKSIQTDDISDCLNEIEIYINSEEKNKTKVIVLQTMEPTLAADYISAALWEAEQGTLILDEADSINISEAPCYDQIIRYGRNKNIHLITGVRRPAELDRSISAGANQLYAFGTHEPRDVEYFEKTIFGQKAKELIKVPRYHGIFVDYDKVIMGTFRIDIDGKIYQDNIVTY